MDRVSGSPSGTCASVSTSPSAANSKARRGRPSHPSLEDIEMIDHVSRGMPQGADLDAEPVDAAGGITATTIPARIDTRSLVRDIRRGLLGTELDADEGHLCRAAAKKLDAAARREEAARARGATGARARPTADAQLRERPRRSVVREVCEELGLEPPYHDKALSKMLDRARHRRCLGRSTSMSE